MTNLLTPTQAYLAMFRFIEGYRQRDGRHSDEQADMLSYASPGMWSPTDDNPLGTGDPAAWSDWLSAVGAALEKRPPTDSPGAYG